MYSREERMKAIELYIKYDKCIADVIRELGYPCSHLLPRWYEAYLKEQETGVLWDRYSRSPKYSLEQKVAAVEHYLEHGRNLSRTARLGIPPRKRSDPGAMNWRQGLAKDALEVYNTLKSRRKKA